MIIVVTESAVRIERADDFRAFHVTAPRGWDLAKVGMHLARAGAGSVGEKDAQISPEWIVRSVTVTDEWTAGFAKMREYARTKGWIAADGSISAHVEFEA